MLSSVQTVLAVLVRRASPSIVRFLAVHAVQLLAPYLSNFVLDTPNTVKLPPPVTINVPPLQLYSFIPLTGRIIARTILGTTTTVEARKAWASIDKLPLLLG